MSRARIAVMASGGGSNLQSLIDHFAGTASAAGEIVLVASNRAEAGALVRAKTANIDAVVITPDTDLLAALHAHRIDLLVLAGYLKLIPADVVHAFHGRLLNVHPSLLPAFGGAGMYGSHVHRAVIDAGAKQSGATVHFVDAEFDRGAIIAQWPVPVLATDTPTTLAARVLAVEHRLFPLCVAAVASGAVHLAPDGRVVGAASLAHPDSVHATHRL